MIDLNKESDTGYIRSEKISWTGMINGEGWKIFYAAVTYNLNNLSLSGVMTVPGGPFLC